MIIYIFCRFIFVSLFGLIIKNLKEILFLVVKDSLVKELFHLHHMVLP